MTDNSSPNAFEDTLPAAESDDLRAIAERAKLQTVGDAPASKDNRTSEALFELFSALGGRFDQQHERERAELLASIRR